MRLIGPIMWCTFRGRLAPAKQFETAACPQPPACHAEAALRLRLRDLLRKSAARKRAAAASP